MGNSLDMICCHSQNALKSSKAMLNIDILTWLIELKAFCSTQGKDFLADFSMPKPIFVQDDLPTPGRMEK